MYIFHKYSAPKFVLGVVVSIFSITSYLKIFFTSYLGVLFIKVLYLLNLENLFIDLVIDLGFWNNDVESLINYSINFYWLNFSLLVLIFYLFYKSIKQPGFIINYFEK